MNTSVFQQIGISGDNGQWLLIIAVLLGLILIVELVRVIQWFFANEKHQPARADGLKQPTSTEASEQTSWTCPRCKKVIDVDPNAEDTNFCPECKQSFWLITCPKCGKAIWSDSPKCPECQAELPMGKCPSCGRHFFISQYAGSCPYCDEKVWLCPRCNQYIKEDPDEADECPECHQTLKTYDCPECSHDNIYADQQVCPGCQKTLQFEACPECGKSIPSGLGECPYCNEDLETTDCPHCKKEHYA
jgi:membrane protease subunit (stomatin/prohibitin family)